MRRSSLSLAVTDISHENVAAPWSVFLPRCNEYRRRIEPVPGNVWKSRTTRKRRVQKYNGGFNTPAYRWDQAQRDLTAAENNEMQVTPTSIDSLIFIQKQCEIYRDLTVVENLTIRIDSKCYASYTHIWCHDTRACNWETWSKTRSKHLQ